MIFCVCLPGIMENSVNCHGKIMEFYFQISVRTLFKPLFYFPQFPVVAAVPVWSQGVVQPGTSAARPDTGCSCSTGAQQAARLICRLALSDGMHVHPAGLSLSDHCAKSSVQFLQWRNCAKYGYFTYFVKTKSFLACIL